MRMTKTNSAFPPEWRMYKCVHYGTAECAAENPDCATRHCGECDCFGDMVNLLGRYEDTGLTPEQIVKLAEQQHISPIGRNEYGQDH